MCKIDSFVQVTELIATSGQPTREQFAGIAELGHRVVINLAMSDSDRALPDEGSIVTSLGMSYIHIPVPFDKPTAAHLQQFIAVMRALEGSKVWVHCVRNWRVSVFMYRYLRYERGLPEEACRSPVLDQWLPTMDDAWKHFLEDL